MLNPLALVLDSEDFGRGLAQQGRALKNEQQWHLLKKGGE